jgi:methylglutaconyl-CoA hydratase
MTSVAGLEIDAKDGVIEAVVDQGDGNLFTTDMCGVLSACLEQPPPGAHILHLRAEGPAFCLGRVRGATDIAGFKAETAALIRLNRAIAESPLLTVAEVGGDAAGYGVGLAALCDISIVAPSVEMWFPEVGIGLAPAIVLAWLPEAVGRKQALLLSASGEKIGAGRAAEIGLVTEVAPDDGSLAARTSARIEALARFSPQVHAEIKRFISVTAGMNAEEAYELAGVKLVTAGLELTREQQA